MNTKERRLSLRESEKKLRNLKGPNGRGICRWCGTEVPPGRRSFCSDAHVHEWRLRSDGQYLREQVYKRDLGKCASCKTDTRLQKIAVEDALHAAGYAEKTFDYLDVLKSLNITIAEARKSLWQADHVLPVENGGGLCDLDNFQTLCIKCHKFKTAGQASYRSKPRKIKGEEVRGVKRVKGVDGIKGFSGKM